MRQEQTEGIAWEGSNIASEESLLSPRSSLYVVNVCWLLQQCQLREFWTVTQSLALLVAANFLILFNRHYCHSYSHLMECMNARSVVILDNASIHHVDGVVDLIESTGALVFFLPPYSPDLNAIEEAFSKLKITLRAIEALLDILDVGITCMHCNYCTRF